MTIDIGDKVKLADDAPRDLICLHGSLAVMTVQGVVADCLMLTHNYTKEDFIARKSEVVKLTQLQALHQQGKYESYLDQFRPKSE